MDKTATNKSSPARTATLLALGLTVAAILMFIYPKSYRSSDSLVTRLLHDSLGPRGPALAPALTAIAAYAYAISSSFGGTGKTSRESGATARKKRSRLRRQSRR